MSTSTRDSTRQAVLHEISPAASQRPSANLPRPTSSTSDPTTRGSERRARSQSPRCLPPPPCTAITWDAQPFTQTLLSTPAALQAFLEGLTTNAGGGDTARMMTTAAAEGRPAVRPLLVLRGLAPAFLRALLDAPLGVDARFVEAHAARRRYRRSREPAAAPAPAPAQWNYPELVGGFAQAIWAGQEAALPIVGASGGRAALRAVSDCEDLAAVECRASVWAAERVDVLFLDKPVWGDPGGLLRKASRRKGTESVTTLVERRVDDDDETEGKGWGASNTEDEEEVQSLEEALQETMSTCAFARGGSNVRDILAQTVYDKWLDFFEVLTPRQSPLVVDGTSLEWRALQALEGNLDTAKWLARTASRPSQLPDWASLIQRLRDRTALLATIPTAAPAAASPHQPKRQPLHADNLPTMPLPVPRRRRRRPQRALPPPPPPASPAGGDENQRSLDRVTYLGGILLPISIVCSVLSMNDDFEPGQRLFWVFWAAAVPLTLLTFVIIYADKLRGSQVWVEVESLGGAGSSAEGDQKKKKKGKEGKKKKTHDDNDDDDGTSDPEKWGGWAPAGEDGTTRMERRAAARLQARTYAGDEEVVVIDLSDAAVPPEPIVLEPRSSHQPPDDDGADPHRPSNDDDDDDDDDDEEEEDTDPPTDMYISRPTDGTRPHAWRKKQLGWGGAAMCILGMQKPRRVADGLPLAPEA